MRPVSVQIPPWPLGRRFIDSKRRTFQVVQTIFGDIDSKVSFRIDFEGGWSVVTQGDDYPQTMAGFVLEGSQELIIQTVDELDEFVKNGHLKIL